MGQEQQKENSITTTLLTFAFTVIGICSLAYHGVIIIAGIHPGEEITRGLAISIAEMAHDEIERSNHIKYCSEYYARQ